MLMMKLVINGKQWFNAHVLREKYWRITNYHKSHETWQSNQEKKKKVEES